MKRGSQDHRRHRSKRGFGVGWCAIGLSVIAVLAVIPVLAGRGSGPGCGGAALAAEGSGWEMVVTLDLSEGRGQDTEHLLLAEDRPVVLVDGSRRRVKDLSVGQGIRLEDGRVGLVTDLAPVAGHRSTPGTTPGTTRGPAPAGACFQARRVLGTSMHTTNTLVTVQTPRGRVDSTPDHPFMTSASGWRVASGLTVGDRLVTRSSGGEVPVESVEARSVSAVAVYNLTIEEAHAYFVGPDALLVHNTGGCGPGPSVEPSERNENRAKIEMGTPPGLTGVHLDQARARANAKFDDGHRGFVQFSKEEWSELESAMMTLETTSKDVKGGRSYGNNGKPPLLPQFNFQTNATITYYEYDLRPREGARGPKRLVIGSDGSAYITGNHYHGFMPIRQGSWKGWALAWAEKRSLQQYGYFEPTPTNQ